MYIDIHTHSIDNQPIIKIVDDNSITVRKIVGIHPWQLDGLPNADAALDGLLQAIVNENVMAIGEVGIDKTHRNTISIQEEVFKEEITLSEKFRKPLIIHAVKAYSDVMNLRKSTKARQPWIIHGFRGSKESARQLTGHGLYLSLGDVLFGNKKNINDLLDNIDLSRIFFETDVAKRDIVDVYEKFSELTGIPLEKLCNIIFTNFATIFH